MASTATNLVITLVTAVLQILLLLLAAPLVNGVIKKVKARWQCRRGPGILQMYYDLWKYLRKDEVVSEHASWLYRCYPWVTFAAILTAGLLIPLVTTRLPLGFGGDLLVVIGLFALIRFFTALAGLEAASAFGGMGSSREMALSTVIEPAMMLGFFVIALEAQSTNLGQIVESLAKAGLGAISPAYLLTFIALMVVVVAETGRVPLDNPDTHLELTMVHEGMLLEYSGRSLGLMFWGAAIKQLLVLSLLANIFFPWGVPATWAPLEILVALPVFLLKVLALGAMLACIETAFAKMRLFKVPELLGASLMLSLMALISLFVVRN
ncbi:MAG: NADH-quinone oxidoreductase subunit H [Carboxydocellales bacterium]